MGESKDGLFPSSAMCPDLVLEESAHVIQIARTFGVHALSLGFCFNIPKLYVNYFIYHISSILAMLLMYW